MNATVVAPLEGVCGEIGGSGVRVTFTCSFNNPLSSLTCSFDGGPPEDCSPRLVVSIERFGTDPHTVVMTATDEFGQTFSLTRSFHLRGQS